MPEKSLMGHVGIETVLKSGQLSKEVSLALHCHGEAATSCLASLHALNEANSTRSLCCHAGWASGPVARTLNNASHIEEHHQLQTSTVLTFSASETLDSSTEASGACSLVHSWRIIIHHHWWLSLASLVILSHFHTLAAIVWVLLTDVSSAKLETSGWFVALGTSL